MKLKNSLLLCLFLSTGTCQLPATEPASSRKQTDGPQLQAVLEAEASGQRVDRRSTSAAEELFSQWQQGILTVDDRPMAYEQMVASGKREDYLKERARQPLDDERHLQLAKWCHQRGFTQEYRAHLHAVLLEKPHDLRARRALGHVWIGNRWLTAEEIQEASLRTQTAISSLKRWLPVLDRMTRQLSVSSAKAKRRALQRLNEIDSPEAVFAMELLIPSLDENTAAMLVNRISEFRSREACLALTRLAIQLQGTDAGSRALKGLREFHRDHYVPELLNLLTVPAQAKSMLTHLPNGDLVLHRLVMRELQDCKELHRYTKYVGLGQQQFLQVNVMHRLRAGATHVGIQNSTLDHRKTASHRRFVSGRPAGSSFHTGGDILADDVSLKQSLLAEQQILDTQLATLEQDSKQLNAAIMAVLAQTQEVNPGNTPESWWNWWIEENERYAKRKPVHGYSRYASEYNPAQEVACVRTQFRMISSCLVKGTPIQTSRGLLAVDKLQIGDLVMAQDVETGELALKPVIQTTTRPPEKTLSIVTAEETIQATPGHCWWVSGRGWLRTKELQAGMMLHTASGNTEIQALREDGKEVETYNLVVADFNTYFVGQQRVLSYDNTQVRPTLRALPGYGKIAMK